ncbi:MAG: hypothetical protein JXQ65_02835 [Candidatus Marinimicrobia bacterium]|nr:hypothetical protein [Candidatus Neomarinimicrobiota bacterium]
MLKITTNQSILKSIPDQRIDHTSSVSKDQKEKITQKDRFGQKAFVFSEDEKKMIQKLKARDREVRTHEQQHKAVAGPYARSMSFSYQTGPDGRQYAIGGQVQLDTSEIPDDPKATIEKLKQIKRAALAPAKPSAKDRQVAAESDREIVKQQTELNEQNRKKMESAYDKSEDFYKRAVNIYI